MIGIVSYGTHVPRLRLNRKSMAAANAWMDPSLLAHGKGERAMANWDEDSVTMAVEAARDCLAEQDRGSIQALYFASTSLPFGDRQNAGIVAAALNLSEQLATLDVTASQKAGTSGLLAALNTAKAMGENVLFAAADKRRTKSASVQEMQFGDGAAALLLGSGEVVAEFLGGHSASVDFVDHYRGKDQPFDYGWEERWIRDEGIGKIVPPVITRALEKAGVSPEQVDHFVMPCVYAGVAASVARKVGLLPQSVRDNLAAVCGETGTAHAIVMLVDALQDATPGQLLLVCGFGQGCDALVFRATERLAALPRRVGVKGSLARRKEETNYLKFLTFNRLITQERGLRAEYNPQTALSVLYRRRRMILGLMGGICPKCNTPQFPKEGVCVNPECKAVGSQEDYPFADQPTRVASWSADTLTYSMDPPAHYGMIQFDGGGCFMADFTDCDVGGVEVGMPMRMVFRVMGVDEMRGMTRYFWKAAPISVSGKED
nr:3-oxoacyl-[acyl-carrier-protein] synthase III C-terminal domain-containing protein [Rhodoferax sp.]